MKIAFAGNLIHSLNSIINIKVKKTDEIPWLMALMYFKKKYV